MLLMKHPKGTREKVERKRKLKGTRNNKEEEDVKNKKQEIRDNRKIINQNKKEIKKEILAKYYTHRYIGIIFIFIIKE